MNRRLFAALVCLILLVGSISYMATTSSAQELGQGSTVLTPSSKRLMVEGGDVTLLSTHPAVLNSELATVPMSENFENPWPVPGWLIEDKSHPANDYLWGRRDCHPHNGSYAAWSTGIGNIGTQLNCGDHYPNDLETWAIYGPFDLSSATSASLTFYFWGSAEVQTNCTADRLYVASSTDGQNFSKGQYFCGYWEDGPEGNGYFKFSLDLKDRLGQSQVYIGFEFKSNSSVTDTGFMIDDLTLDVNGITAPTPTPTPTNTPVPPTSTPTRTPTATPSPTPTSRPVVVLVHGWQGLGKRQYRCKDGITSYNNDQNFEENNSQVRNIADWLTQDGFQVWSAHLDSGPDLTTRLEDNAKCLRDQIAQVSGQGKVTIIAHSMGGLVARALIEDESLYQNNVRTLFTIGTPHNGVPIVLETFFIQLIAVTKNVKELDCNQQQALCQFIWGINVFNSTYSKRNKTVAYYLVGGDLGWSDATNLGRLSDALIRGKDDGIVPTSSSLDLPGARQTLETNEAHIKDFSGISTYFGVGKVSSAYKYCIRPVLLGKLYDCSKAAVASSEANEHADDPNFTSLTPFLKGSISSNQLISKTIYVDGGGTLFAASWITGALTLSLVDPNGQAIDPGYAMANPNVVSYLQSAEGSPLLGATYYITTPQVGKWTMVLQVGDIVGGSTDFAMVTSLESSITLETSTNRDWYAQGEPILITTTLTGGKPASSVEAHIRRPDKTVDVIILTHQAGDVYTGVYATPSLPGYYLMETTAIGAEFERFAVLKFVVAPRTAQLNDYYRDYVLNDSLAVDVGVTTFVDGAYTVAAKLIAQDGTLITSASTTAQLGVDTSTVTLVFDGTDIGTSGKAGPFIVTSVLLIDSTDLPLPIQQKDNVHTATFGANLNLHIPYVAR